jgi:hypothetical protein
MVHFSTKQHYCSQVSMLDKSVLLLFNLKYFYINVDSMNEGVLFWHYCNLLQKDFKKGFGITQFGLSNQKETKSYKNNRKALTRSYLQQDNFATVKAYIHV